MKSTKSLSLVALYPQVPSKVLLLVFKKYRQESQKLTGKLVSEIFKEVEMRVDFLLQHLTMEELEFVAEGFYLELNVAYCFWNYLGGSSVSPWKVKME